MAIGQSSNKYVPMWLLAELTYACPLQCPYCSNPLALPGSRKDELSTEEWIRVMREARKLGADAVVGIDFDYETLGANGSMLMVAVSGTAVRLG